MIDELPLTERETPTRTLPTNTQPAQGPEPRLVASPAEIGTVGINPRFFTHELNNYSNWPWAFWRELLQNSVDAGATKIDLIVSKAVGEDMVETSVADNGPGMDETTLRDIYFQLGATSKEDTDAIGGHGRARILTCFAHEGYTIRTQNLACSGRGGSYKIQHTEDFFRGCTVNVTTKATSLECMQEALNNMLAASQLEAQITLNGEVWRGGLPRRRASRTISFGSLHVTRNPDFLGRVIFRVRGLPMFERSMGAKAGAIVEINPSESRTILTVSRDSLKYPQSREVDALLAEVAVDRRSLQRECEVNRSTLYGNFKAPRYKKEQPPEEDPFDKDLTEAVSPAFGAALRLADPLHQSTVGFVPTLGVENPAPVMDYAIHFEDATPSQRSAGRKFEPERIGGRRLKVLRAWAETLDYVVGHLNAMTGENHLYMPGLVFSDGRGLHRSAKDDYGQWGHILHINPCDSTGKMRVRHTDTRALYSIALHEAAHIVYNQHHEDYAGVLTELTAQTCGAKQLAELNRRIKQAVAVKVPEKPTATADRVQTSTLEGLHAA